MPDWLAPVAILLLVTLLLLLTDWLGRRRASAPPRAVRKKKDHAEIEAAKASKATASNAPKGESSNRESSNPDSIKLMTVSVTVPSKSGKPVERAQNRSDTTPATSAPVAGELPRLDDPEDDAVDPTFVGKRVVAIQPPTHRIVYDEDAAVDEPTNPHGLFLVTATAQTDKGMRRKRNEDSLLVMEHAGIFVVADGMGGYSGGEIASKLAVQTIQRAFETDEFIGEPHAAIPRRASELARAVQMANDAILAHAASDTKLEGMGTTICAARFSPDKERLYVSHVGDSRMYRFRNGQLRQMTSDHTMRDLGVTGAGSDHLSRAVGVWPTVPIDTLLAKPLPGDLYLLCSDGLTKMVDDATIARVLSVDAEPSELVDELVRHANERGGKDNITAILIRVHRTKVEQKSS